MRAFILASLSTPLCNKHDWHTAQEKAYIIPDCPSQDLTDLRNPFQHLFSSAPPNNAQHLRVSSTRLMP
eukprot:1159527-Pelagomonas_calceolata.AAC.9